MKLFQRMIVIIFLGIIAGGVVIAYLERDYLIQQWGLYFGEVDYTSDEHQTVSVNPGTLQTADIHSHSEIEETMEGMHSHSFAPIVQTQPKPIVRKQLEQPDLGTLLGVGSERREPEHVQHLPESTPFTNLKSATQQTTQRQITSPLASPAISVQQLEPVASDVSARSGIQHEKEEVTEVKTTPRIEVLNAQKNVSEAFILPSIQGEMLSANKPLFTLPESYKNQLEDIWSVEDTEHGYLHGKDSHAWLLDRGRQFFLDKNYDVAVKSYRLYLQEVRTNANAWGELGNLYRELQEWDKAVHAYSQAARLIIESGNMRQAQQVLEIIQQLDPAAFRRIEQEFSSDIFGD